MQVHDSLYSLNLEKYSLAGFIRNPDYLIEYNHIFTEKDFYNKTHRLIFSILKNQILSGQKVDKVILAQKIVELGIKSYEEINIFDYIDAISYISINKDGLRDTVKELIKLRIRRELWQNATAIQAYIQENGDKAVTDIIREVDSLHHNQIYQFSSDEDPVDLYEGIEDLIKNIANNPVEEVGLITPFSFFNKFFGGLRAGNGCYNIISRAGEGKSCWLFNMAKGVAMLNACKVLYIDTEMSLDLNQFRAASAESQVGTWFLETGQWVKNPEYYERVTKSFSKLSKYKGHVYHKYAPNKDINQVLSIMRQWFYKNVGRGNKALIIYDYLKITSDIDKNRQEYQQLGDKISLLNELGAQLNVPIFIAGQQNRSGEMNGGMVRNDDSTTAAASDRINQYACLNGVFRMKTVDEVTEHGDQFGTHLFKPFKFSRTNGKDSFAMNRFVKVFDQNKGKSVYKQNFVNYEISNYDIIEKGTYQEIINHHNLNQALQANPPHHNHNANTI